MKKLLDVHHIEEFEIEHRNPVAHGLLESPYIRVNHTDNTITFKIQDGPIKENGVNGCQVDTIIAASMAIIKGLNGQFPCRENSLAVTKLQEALLWLEERKRDRIKRGVEGLNKE